VQYPCYHFDPERLKLCAQRHGRSLPGEVKGILEAAAILSGSGTGGALTDDTQTIRKGRERCARRQRVQSICRRLA
jgi:plasmid stability protein